jgi:drug/metabolite transporter (DMT)-like permease
MQKHPDMSPRPHPSSLAHDSHRVKSIGLMVLATLCFAVLDTTGKYLIVKEGVPVAEVSWLRFVGHVVFNGAVLWPLALKPSLRSAKPTIQILRSVLMVATTGLNFLALRYLQLDQTVTIFFLTPLLVAALAGPLLNEWAGWHRMLAIAVGFIGVLLVVHPGIGTVHWAMLLGLGATFGYALYNIATRYLASFDPASVTQTYTPLAGVILLAPLALAAWHWPDDNFELILLASLGFWGGLGHWLLILAHRAAPAPVLAPFIYVGLIWMSAFGFLVFRDVPTLWTLSGAAVVILSGLYLLARERKALGAAKIGPASDIATQ